MPKINQEEYEMLKSLDDKWKWIARDKDGEAFMFECEPFRIGTIWNFDDGIHDPLRGDNLFQFIQWEDEEPYSIQGLIDEYLDDEYGYFNMKLSREFEQFNEESEETEVKNIEEVKDEVAEELEAWRNVEGGVDDEGIDTIMVIIDQLNEPETLSQEWIDGKKLRVRNRIPFHMDVEYAVPEEDLKKALLPKQEEITEEQVAEHLRERNMTAVDSALVYREKLDNKIVIEKPTIPQFVADFIESYDGDFYSLLHEAGIISSDATLVTEEYYELGNWLSVNSDEILQAVANGYEVAEEPKYRLKLNGDYLSRAQIDYEADKGNPMEVTIHVDVNGFPYNFSEDEKSYVEKYLNVEVEELEE